VSHHCFRFAFGDRDVYHLGNKHRGSGANLRWNIFEGSRFAGSVSAFILSLLVRKHRLIDVAGLFSLVHAARTYLQQYLRYHNQGRNTLSDPQFFTAKPSPFVKKKKEKGDD